MHEFADGIELFIAIVEGIRQKQISINLSLDEVVIKTGKDRLAYVDNRKAAKERYDFDFWEQVKKRFKDGREFTNWMRIQGMNERTLYSSSAQFPDFMFKVRKQDDKLGCGSLLELKDSASGSIASFNSTLPTKHKSLEEIDIINGTNLVSRITSIIDGELALNKDYRTIQRKNFYLIRTFKDSDERVKISLVDGSFFETVPKEHLIYHMFSNILQSHLEKKDIKISPELLNEISKSLSYITDQTIIAASQAIDKASVRPRLRIMAEVHSEGNPHSSTIRKFQNEVLTSSFKHLIMEKLRN